MKNIDHLITSANRIGNFFQSLPDRAEGIEGVTNHIQKFWEPRMRIALLDFLAEHPDGQTANNALNEMALMSISQNVERLTPKATA